MWSSQWKCGTVLIIWIVTDALFFPIFHDLSYYFLCTYASFVDLVVFVMQQLSYHTDTCYLSSHVTNGNVPWSRFLAQLLLSHVHLHLVQGYAFHFCLFFSMSWLCHSFFISTMLSFSRLFASFL